MECSVEKVLSYIKETLIKDNPSLSLGDLEELNADTDLIYYGIESILVLSIISELETLFKKKISLEYFESSNYSITAESITNNLNNDKP